MISRARRSVSCNRYTYTLLSFSFILRGGWGPLFVISTSEIVDCPLQSHINRQPPLKHCAQGVLDVHFLFHFIIVSCAVVCDSHSRAPTAASFVSHTQPGNFKIIPFTFYCGRTLWRSNKIIRFEQKKLSIAGQRTDWQLRNWRLVLAGWATHRDLLICRQNRNSRGGPSNMETIEYANDRWERQLKFP